MYLKKNIIMVYHFLRWLLAIFSSYTITPSLSALVKMDPVVPFEGKTYYIRCVLETELVELEELRQTPFRFQLNDKTCDVPSWLKCDSSPQRLKDWDCYCYRKYVTEELLMFDFYYFIKTFPGKVVNLTSCGLEYYASDKREVETVDFSVVPGPAIQNCSDGEMVLNWGFHPHSDFVRELMRPKKIEWFFQDRPLADYVVSRKAFVSHVNQCCAIVKNGLIPMLKLKRLTNTSSGVYSINVIFHAIRTKAGNTRQDTIDLYGDEGETAIRIKRTFFDMESFGAFPANTTSAEEYDYDPDVKLMPSLDETTTLPPIPVAQNSLNGSTKLMVTYPPNNDVWFKMKGFKTLTGTILVRCSVYNISYFGLPEVNLTLWEMSRRVRSKPGEYSLVYSEAIGGRRKFNFSCGLTGVALQCLDSEDSRLKRVYLDEIESEKPPDNLVPNIMKIIFGTQTVLCIGLMLWLVSLMLKHVLVVINKEMRMNQLAAKMISTKAGQNMLMKAMKDRGDVSEREDTDVDEDSRVVTFSEKSGKTK
ncbi:uncharacterized protein LOC106052967 isoform X1 [Biomphalaria glabrata]|uniref:Uncharacterized protein LOC106052967 isoform X1 n=1 Tax=Biomphalaria glabrata TaxID=6526 RepID=A0A9W2YJX1_BIOGL|nr:uncharacterized protein LOC106052967 isoform X1 [Biomphalaria glabrata]